MDRNENSSGKPTNNSWWILGLGFLISIIGVFMIVAAPDIGVWVCIGGLCIPILWCVWYGIKSILATKKPGVTTLKFLGIVVAEIALALICVVLELDVWIGVVLALIILFIGFRIKVAVDNTACPKCGKKFAMKEVSRKVAATYPATMDITHEIKDTKGRVTGTYVQTVPATLYIYNCVDECKFCGHRVDVRREHKYRD